MGLQWSLQPLHVAMLKNRNTVSMKYVSQFKLDAVLIVSDANCVKNWRFNSIIFLCGSSEKMKDQTPVITHKNQNSRNSSI